MEKLRTPLIVVISILIGIFGFLTYQSMVKKPTTENAIQIMPTSAPTRPEDTSLPVSTEMVASPTLSQNNSWITYSCVPLGFSINHPADLEPKKQAETISFSKWGPSQGAETEFYDGISLTFSGGMYVGNFDAFVNRKLQEVKEWLSYVSSTEPKALVMAEKEAWSFEAVTMGKAIYYYVKKNENLYLEIIDATNDPTSQGFKDIVSQMLSTLKII